MSEILIPMALAAIIGAVYTAVFIWHSNGEPGKEPALHHCGRCGLCQGENGGESGNECKSKINGERGNSNE